MSNRIAVENSSQRQPADPTLAALEANCAREPSDAAHWFLLGANHTARRQLPAARAALERGLALRPEDDEGASLLGWVLNEMGETRRALQVLAAIRPPGRSVSFGRRVRSALILPQVYESAEVLAQWRARYARGLAALADEPSRHCRDPREVFGLNHSNFLLAYQGGADLPLQRQYAGMIGALIGTARPDLVAPRERGKNRGRIRVAFVSDYLRECTIGHYFRSWIERLDSTRFEKLVVYTGAESEDETTRATGAAAERLVVERGNALDLARLLLDMAADILVYPEVGMQAKNYLLTNMRLAPVQCAAWGHPVTTGSSQVDYYFTCGEMEPPKGADHYTEQLLPLPGIGTAYRRPDSVDPRVTRAALGLPAEAHLYVCPQSLFKVHPDNDALYLDIMEADPKAIILFFQEHAGALTASFGNRLADGMAARGIPPRQQIKLLPWMSAAAFRGLLSLADVVLDTLHWSGGNTSLDALSVGTPIVTLPGRFMRGRQSMAMLSRLGVAELIAGDRQSYVAKALQVAAEPDYRRALTQRILGNHGELYERIEPIRALEEHLERIALG